MKKKVSFLLVVVLFLLCSFPVYAFQVDIDPPCFSPNGGCEQTIVKELNKSRSEVLVQAYSFTSAPIAKALLSAKRRGINVQAILDKSQKKQRYSSYTFFNNQSIPVFIDSAHAIAHNKIMIIDQQIIITGSYNFTAAAEKKNAENLLIIRSRELADRYIRNWKEHRGHSE